MSEDDIFEAAKEAAIFQKNEAHLVSWEETIVTRLVNFYNLRGLGPVLRGRCRDATGKGRLLFSWFQKEFPTFPVWLTFRRVPYLHQLTMEDFVRRFSKTLIWKGWEEIHDEVPEWWLDSEGPVGMVFEYLHGMGAAIMTDCERPLGENHTRIVKNFKKKNYYMEPLGEFLSGLAWRPPGL